MSAESSTLAENNISLPRLSNDLLGVLDHSSRFSDAVLKCGGVEIPVHKCILSARSPVFSAMFQTEMQEGLSGNVNIIDVELDVLQIILKYIYSGKTDGMTDKVAEDLLVAADKYGLIDLKQICIEKLKSVLSMDNAIRILILGHLHDTDLKALAKELICKCKFSDLEETEDWSLFQEDYPKLAVEVMRSIVKYLQDLSDEAANYKIKIIGDCVEVISLDVNPTHTIQNVKQMIQDKEGISVDKQKLFLLGELLEDEALLSDNFQKLRAISLSCAITIFIQEFTAGGKTFTVPDVGTETTTFKDMKLIIQDTEKIPVDDQFLLYEGMKLENGKTCSDYNITNNSTLTLVLRYPRFRSHFR